MHRHHRIQKVRFDIRYRSKAMMLADQSAIAATIRGQLMPEVDAVLSASEIAGSHIRIERLQIDLGRIPYADLKNEMEKRLQEKLGDALQQKIASLKARPAAGEGIISLHMKLLGELGHFLVTGTLPWPAETGQRDLAQRLQIVLKEAASDFHNFLKCSRSKPQVLQRFVRQFPETTLKQVLRELVPDRAQQIIAVAEDLLKIHQRTAPGGRDDPTLIHLIWECVLDYVLENRQRSLTTAHFFKWVARRSKRAHGVIWQRFTEITAAVEADSDTHDSHSTDLAPATRAIGVSGNAASQRIIEGYELYAALRRYLDNGVMGRDIGQFSQAVKEIWGWAILSELRHRHPEQFMRVVLEMAQRPSLCERICEHLPGRQILLLLEAMLGVCASGRHRDSSAFLTSVNDAAGNIGDRNGFYAEILHRIAGGRAVDPAQTAQSHRAAMQTGQRQGGNNDHKRATAAHARDDQPDKSLPRNLTAKETAAVFEYLEGSPLPYTLSEADIKADLERMALRDNNKLIAFVRDHLNARDITLRWVRLLSERGLTRVLAKLRTDLHAGLQTAVDVVVNAGYSSVFFDRPEELHSLKWEFVFTDPAIVGKIYYRQGDFISRFIGFLAGRTPTGDTAAFREFLIGNLAQNNQVSSCPQHQAVLYELKNMTAQTHEIGTPGAPKPQTVKLAAPPQTAGMPRIQYTGRFNQATDVIESAVVHNAGLVIVAPYLPQLWKMLSLTEDSKFIDPQAAERAVHLLQFMADARTRTPEYDLVLNKILCGIEISEPICGGIEISERERGVVEELIQAMIENWKTIGSTSVAGFRESFLQRRGRLVLKENGWHLKVTQKAFDMLLDRIPWSFSTIKHAWMEKVVLVSWR